MTDPYRIPDDGWHYTVNVSGGLSSGYLLRHVLNAHDGELPANASAVFANTGKEMPQTLDFVRDMQERWDVPITWLEYHYRPDAKGGQGHPKQHYRVVDWKTAARAGEPFEDLIQDRRYIPNVSRRLCSAELKVGTVKRWLWREHRISDKRHRRILGIRYDEPRRWGKAMNEECQTRYPMALAEVTKADVLAYWEKSNFTLQLPTNGLMGNCDLCFLKTPRKIIQILREQPDMADWWIRMEGLRNQFSRQQATSFLEKYTYTEMREIARGQPELDFGADGVTEIDCFCGD